MIQPILSGLLKSGDITVAALVGKDGFVIETASTIPIDTDALGAMTSTGIRYFEMMGFDLGKGELRQVVIEMKKGILILLPLDKDYFIAVITDPGSNTRKILRSTMDTRLQLAAGI